MSLTCTQPLTDSSGAYRMVIAARYPTDTIKEIEEIFSDGLATADGVRSVDHKQEVADRQVFALLLFTL